MYKIFYLKQQNGAEHDSKSGEEEFTGVLQNDS